MPNRQARPISTPAPITTRPQARKAGGTPSSTATLMKRYGTPEITEAAANAIHARRLIGVHRR
jgi:hypothetical protein